MYCLYGRGDAYCVVTFAVGNMGLASACSEVSIELLQVFIRGVIVIGFHNRSCTHHRESEIVMGRCFGKPFIAWREENLEILKGLVEELLGA